jgi:hypothetical protein
MDNDKIKRAVYLFNALCENGSNVNTDEFANEFNFFPILSR